MTNSIKLLQHLTSQHGDAFYILDIARFEKNLSDFIAAFRTYFPNVEIAYSYKTNYIPEICNLAREKGCFAEVVSEMEYELALKIGTDPARIIVNGPGKSAQALNKFLLGGSIVHADSLREVDAIVELSNQHRDTQMRVGLRCNFGLTEQISRFGLDVATQDFREAIDSLTERPNIRIVGLHCHFPNRDLESFGARITNMLDIMNEHFEEPLEYINIGGGFFGRMSDELAKQFPSKVPSYQEYSEEISTAFSDASRNFQLPNLLLEPGSALVADTMQFVVRVTDIKIIRGEHFAITSGSKFNLGHLHSTINLPIRVVRDRADSSENYHQSIDLVGYTCIEDDVLFRGYRGNLDVGDYVCFENAGSYSFVFKPPFIRPNVPILSMKSMESQPIVVKKAETFEDIISTYPLVSAN